MGYNKEARTKQDAYEAKFLEIARRIFGKDVPDWSYFPGGTVTLDGQYDATVLRLWITVLDEFDQFMYDSLMADGEVETAKAWLA